MRDSNLISPTAHYTAFVWYKNDLSHEALATPRGRAYYWTLYPFQSLARFALGGLTLERMLLQRHRVIDYLLENAITEGRVTQVLEVAAGLSPRGFRMVRRHPDLRYVEADLPDMAAEKRQRLSRSGLLGQRHEVVPLDVLLDDGPMSVAQIAREALDPGQPTAIITEGLLGYFDGEHVAGIWRRFVRALKALGGGLYLSDLHLRGEAPDTLWVRLFQGGLDRFTKGKTYLHFEDAAETRQAMLDAGFDQAECHAPSSFRGRVELPEMSRPDVLRILEATVAGGS